MASHSLMDSGGLVPQYRCETCKFELFIPLMNLRVSSLGLYDDVRFRGRCLLVLNRHYDHLDEVPESLMIKYMLDVQDSLRALKIASGSERINFAVLGNTEAHVHAHLIPRFPEEEEFPLKAPWEDLRRKSQFTDSEREFWISRILESFTKA